MHTACCLVVLETLQLHSDRDVANVEDREGGEECLSQKAELP